MAKHLGNTNLTNRRHVLQAADVSHSRQGLDAADGDQKCLAAPEADMDKVSHTGHWTCLAAEFNDSLCAIFQHTHRSGKSIPAHDTLSQSITISNICHICCATWQIFFSRRLAHSLTRSDTNIVFSLLINVK